MITPEYFGTQPVPKTIRQDGWGTSFQLLCNLFINPATIMTSAMGVASGISWPWVVFIQTFSVIFSMIFFFIMGRIGVDHGLTGQMACRMTLGIQGGRWITSPLRALVSIYWFAYQTQFGSLAILAIASYYFSLTIPFIVATCFFAVIQISLAYFGYTLIKKLFSLFLIAKLSAICILFYYLNYIQSASFYEVSHTSNSKNIIGCLFWFNVIFSGQLSAICDSADLTRYFKNKSTLWIGGLAGITVGMILASSLGAIMMNIMGTDIDRLFISFLNQASSNIAAIALVTLMILDNITINAFNLYIGGISLSHTLENHTRLFCTILVSIGALTLSLFPHLIQTYMSTLEAAGILFAAITGVILTDYIQKKWNIIPGALYAHHYYQGKINPYWYQGGFCLLRWGLILGVCLVGYIYLPENWPNSLIVLILTMLLSLPINHFYLKKHS